MGDTQDAGTPPGTRRVEQRAAKRSSLMLRAAKLLAESGEYVCIVRDVSATGAKLRLFHAPPPDLHLFLELADGERHAMERVWHREDHAGFRFSCEIDVERFIRESGEFPRRPLRLNFQHPTLVRTGAETCDAALADLSQHGACVDAAARLAIGQSVRLEVPGLPVRDGRVRWRRGGRHGLVFQQAFRLDELAGHALLLQPFTQDAADDLIAAPGAARCA